MNAESYLKTSLSPYKLNEDALSLIKKLTESFTSETEEKALVLLNASALHPKMSQYQLSLSHKELGDCYYKHGYFQSALEQYQTALLYNPRIAVKKRIKEIESMDDDKRKSSLSSDIVADVLEFPEYNKYLNGNKSLMFSEDIDGESWDKYKDIFEKAKKELDEYEAKEFLKSMYCVIKTHRSDDPISIREHLIINLRGMMRSSVYRKNNPK